MRKQFLSVMLLCGALLMGCQGQEMTEEKYNNMSIEEQIQYNTEQEALIIEAIIDAESNFEVVSYDYSYDEVVIHITGEAHINESSYEENLEDIKKEILNNFKIRATKITNYFEDRGINNVHVILDVTYQMFRYDKLVGYYDLENGLDLKY